MKIEVKNTVIGMAVFAALMLFGKKSKAKITPQKVVILTKQGGTKSPPQQASPQNEFYGYARHIVLPNSQRYEMYYKPQPDGSLKIVVYDKQQGTKSERVVSSSPAGDEFTYFDGSGTFIATFKVDYVYPTDGYRYRITLSDPKEKSKVYSIIYA